MPAFPVTPDARRSLRRLTSSPIMTAALLLVAAAASAQTPWLAADGVDLARVLPPPAAAGSEAARRDMDAVLALQSDRSEAAAAAARADQEVSVFRFADVLGAAFSAERLPKTDALAQQACREASAITARAKKHWKRTRPNVANPAVRPVVRYVTDGSYPSGHATCGYLWAILLADMLPERRDALFARGVSYGTNRIVGGVHYPSDAEAGRLAGAVIATELYAVPAFRTDAAAARLEARSALGFPPSPP